MDRRADGAPTRPGERPGRLRLRQLGRARLLLPRPGRQHRRAHRPSWSRRVRARQVHSRRRRSSASPSSGSWATRRRWPRHFTASSASSSGPATSTRRRDWPSWARRRERSSSLRKAAAGYRLGARPRRIPVKWSCRRLGQEKPTSVTPATESRLELDEHLERLALVHRPVAVGHVVERADAIEDAAGLDLPLENVRQQFLDVRARG